MDTIVGSNADVVCISDARLDSYKDRYIGGYCFSMQKATGKRWRAKFEPRPDRRTKCSVGGDIIFFSEKCSSVVKTPLLPYGTLSSTSMVWEGAKVRILSVYRPYDSKESSEGAFRTATIKVVPDFEEEFWAELCKPSGTPTLIGGDFNMSPDEVDERLLGSQQSRIGLPPGTTTYRSLSRASGSVIDHVISNSEASANVAEDGSFAGDHYPVIGGIKLESMGVPIPVKIEAKIPKTIQPGDVGGLRRLNEAITKEFPGDLTGHSVEEITEWTVKQARAIAASRN